MKITDEEVAQRKEKEKISDYSVKNCEVLIKEYRAKEGIELYLRPAEVWDEKTCAKKSKKGKQPGDIASGYRKGDTLKGFIGLKLGPVKDYGIVLFGCSLPCDGIEYQGEIRPLPVIPDNYEIIYVPKWGYRIKLKD